MTRHGTRPGAVGWIGAGRMGAAMAARLIAAGYQVAIWNRTRSKAEAVTGATVVDRPADLAGHPVVFTMVAGGPELAQVLFDGDGLLTGNRLPEIVVDSSTIDIDEATALRERAAERGVTLLAAPVSGNAKVVKAGKLTFAVSGPKAAYERVRDLLAAIGGGVTYLGEGEVARLVKICHNLLLGVVTQTMAEITVLAEKGGVSRYDFLDFLNRSVMGSLFTRYKTPAFVNLDFTPTFTPVLLRKDFDLGLAAARRLGTTLPVAALVHQLISAEVNRGHVDEDFAILLRTQAENAGLQLRPENRPVTDGLTTEDSHPET